MLAKIFSTPTQDQAIAFSGMFQAARLVYDFAKSEDYDENAFHEILYSVLRLDADTASAVYGGQDNLDLGCRSLIQIFSGKSNPWAKDVMRYILGMDQLAVKLSRQQHSLNQLGDLLQLVKVEYEASYQINHRDDEMCERLADVYTTVVSPITPRIMVQGLPGRLKQPVVVSRVRSALLAGIRSAFLWHQVGGDKMQTLLKRQHYASLAKQLMA